ncbi:MAG: response regulator transcription factor [Opitutales bacterium]|nr:response regulator transcription factor [Opitutales bacterium]
MTARLRALLVDDEPPARELLAELLAVHPEIEIVGEAGDVETAYEVYMRELPDLVFLDIQLPGANGFDLITMIGDRVAVIFVTAYDQFALRAFDVNALDYLLKPIDPDRLTTALTRAKASLKEPDRLSGDGKVVLQEDGNLRFVDLGSIALIEAQDNYTRVHLVDGPPAFIRRALADWEKQLPEGLLLRVGRSLLVKVEAVRSLKTQTRDSAVLTLAGSAPPIQIGRRAALLVRRALGK